MTLMTPTEARKMPKSSNEPAPGVPGGFAGQLLRVDLGKRKCWGEPWSPEDMRAMLGGIGLGAMILYRETRKGKGNVSWDHPDNRLVLGTGPLAGLPVWGTGGLTVVTMRLKTTPAFRKLMRPQYSMPSMRISELPRPSRDSHSPSNTP